MFEWKSTELHVHIYNRSLSLSTPRRLSVNNDVRVQNGKHTHGVPSI